MENLDQERFDLIAKHLRGETSAFEEGLLKEWMNESKENQHLYNEMVWIWKSSHVPIHELPNTEKAWDKVKRKANIQEPSKASEGAKVRPLYPIQNFLKIAASLLIVACAAYFIGKNWFGKEEITEFAAGNSSKVFWLPDSSKITLNKNSKLSFTQSFNDKTRTINLNGEAFFEVKKDKAKPFIVNGKFSQTEVLGTKFNVKTSNENNADKIEVVEGKVSFTSSTNNKDKVYLTIGDKAEIKQGGVIHKSKIESPNFIAWKNHTLAFNNTPLKDVVSDIENYFNIKIKLDNPALQECRFTGNFQNPDINEVMKVLSVSININVNKINNTYQFQGNGCN